MPALGYGYISNEKAEVYLENGFGIGFQSKPIPDSYLFVRTTEALYIERLKVLQEKWGALKKNILHLRELSVGPKTYYEKT